MWSNDFYQGNSMEKGKPYQQMLLENLDIKKQQQQQKTQPLLHTIHEN